MNIKEIREKLNIQDMVKILESVGVEAYFISEEKAIFPTVCHNNIDDNPSNKLYYYNNSKLFTCYTECDHSFDIVELLQKIYKI